MRKNSSGPLHKIPIANLTKREMEKMAMTLHGGYTVTVFETEGGFWTLEIAFHGQEIQRYGIETMRGILKVWRNLSDAIMFAQENCAKAENVYVDFRGWRLSKLDAAGAN